MLFNKGFFQFHSGGLIIKNTDNRTGDAGSILVNHPLRNPDQYKKDKEFKDACCRSGHCYRYYDKRITDDGTNYSPPKGGICTYTHILLIIIIMSYWHHSTIYYSNGIRWSTLSDLWLPLLWLHESRKVCFLQIGDWQYHSIWDTSWAQILGFEPCCHKADAFSLWGTEYCSYFWGIINNIIKDIF